MTDATNDDLGAQPGKSPQSSAARAQKSVRVDQTASITREKLRMPRGEGFHRARLRGARALACAAPPVTNAATERNGIRRRAQHRFRAARMKA